MSDEKRWFFGYGSNMDSDNLTKKKGVVVYQSTPAILHGYKMEFSLPAIAYVEPFFANCEKGGESDSIHGVAFETDEESISKLDKVEMGYDKATVTLDAYDGRKLTSYVYVFKSQNERRTGRPSARYMKLLVDGSRAAGLDKDYLAKLEAVPVYQPSKETLDKRAALAAISYPTKDMTKEDLGQDPSHFISILGYIVDVGPPKGFFTAHHGKDISNFLLRHYMNLPINHDTNPQDALGLPCMEAIDSRQDVRDYMWSWFDQFANQNNAKVVARHRAFLEAQETDPSTGKAKTQWTFPTA